MFCFSCTQPPLPFCTFENKGIVFFLFLFFSLGKVKLRLDLPCRIVYRDPREVEIGKNTLPPVRWFDCSTSKTRDYPRGQNIIKNSDTYYFLWSFYLEISKLRNLPISCIFSELTSALNCQSR